MTTENIEHETGGVALERLVRRYVEAANALNKYRESNGFHPGAKVIAQWRDDPAKAGTIAPYGDAWNAVDHMHVPVLLDNGRRQPWDMRNLTITEAPNEKLNAAAGTR